jgi:hypothetical protein
LEDAFIAGAESTPVVSFNGASAAATFKDSYIYCNWENAHPVNVTGTGGSGTNQVTGNVFETPTIGDSPDMYVPGATSLAFNFANNVLTGYGALIASTANKTIAAVTSSHNTHYMTSDNNYGPMFYIHDGILTGTLTFQSNLVSGAGTIVHGSRDLNNDPGQEIVADYNAWDDVTSHYTNLTVTGATNDIADVEPGFVAPTRDLATWDAAEGSGAGTIESAITYLLAINGYNGTTKTQSDTPSAQGPSDLVTWVQAGFAPTNAALRGTAHDSGDIGAVANTNTAPSIAYTSPDTWNTGEMTITYSLTDADADTNTLTVQYSTDNSNWSTATQGSGGDGTTGLTSSSGGTSHTFVWATTTDLPTTEDSTIYIKITPSDGGGGLTAYTTDSFGVDNVNPTVSAGADQTKTASFTQTATATDSGGINASAYQWAKVSGPGTITFGTATALSTTISASADGAYVISFTASDNAGNSNSDTFTLIWSSASSSTTGGGAPQSFDISVSVGPNGKITPSWGLLFSYGTTQTFSITPNSGYQIADVLIDGVSIGAQPSFTFSSIDSSHSISATFSESRAEQTTTTQQTTQTEQSTSSQEQENIQTTTQEQTPSQKEAVIVQLKHQLITLITQVIQMLYEQIALMKN